MMIFNDDKRIFFNVPTFIIIGLLLFYYYYNILGRQLGCLFSPMINITIFLWWYFLIIITIETPTNVCLYIKEKMLFACLLVCLFDGIKFNLTHKLYRVFVHVLILRCRTMFAFAILLLH